MSKRLTHRISSLVLCAVLICTMLSSAVFAQESESVTDINFTSDVFDQEVEIGNNDNITFDFAEIDPALRINSNGTTVEIEDFDNDVDEIVPNEAHTSPERSADVTDIQGLEEDNSVDAPSRSSSKTRTSTDYYATVSDYLTAQGQNKYIYPIYVYPGETIHCQVDMPNNSAIDYDAYLYEVDAQGNMTLVDYSECATYLNNGRTMPEAVGAVNSTSAVKTYLVMVQSFVGYSASQPFTLNLGINVNGDGNEANENAFHSVSLSLEGSSNTIRSNSSLSTRADNDWYEISFPANTYPYNYASIKLDATSTAAGHTAELYYVSNYALIKVQKSSIYTSSYYLQDGGIYYLRVSANGGAVTNSNYTLTIAPKFIADSIQFFRYEGGQYSTYSLGKMYCARENDILKVFGKATYKGKAVPNAFIGGTVINPSFDPGQVHYAATASATTSAGGSFSLTFHLPSGAGAIGYRVSPTVFHSYDLGLVSMNTETGYIWEDEEDSLIYIYCGSSYS